MADPHQNIEDRIMDRIAAWSAPFDSDITASKKTVMQRIALAQPIKENKKTGTGFRFIFKIAATLLILISCVTAAYFLANQTIRNTSEGSALSTLPDGSEVLLLPHSEYSYNSLLWPLHRAVSFEGEGFFTVTPGDEFVVHTPSGDIKVLGTKFTVWADSDDLFVHCTSGKVEVVHEAQNTLLTANEFTQLEKGVLSKKMVFNSNGFIVPRESNLLSFNSVPVGIVLAELEKIFNTEIENNLPANLIYTGILDIRNLNQCLEVFCKPYGAKFDINSKGDVSIHL